MIKRTITRREMLVSAIGLGGAAFGGNALGQQAGRLYTPELVLGPFYPMLRPLDVDADLTIIKGRKKRAEGEIVHVVGRVLNQRGDPVRGAAIEIWQANANGRYAHRSDVNPLPLDENFQGFAVLKTDALGRYRFKTIKPGPYPVSPTEIRTPHIHVDVKGKHNRLTSQMFFPGEALNEKDMLFHDLKRTEPQNYMAVVAEQVRASGEVPAGETLLKWDIVLLDG